MPETENLTAFQQHTLRTFQIAKQLSQIIAFIWRWADEEQFIEKKEAALGLHALFSYPYSEITGTDSKLKSLFAAEPKQDGTPEQKWLFEVFGSYNQSLKDEGYHFPIFDESEFEGYALEINLNSFTGNIKDPTLNENKQQFTFSIPYPPRPQLGVATVTEEILDAWIDNRTSDQYFSRNPYIPTTCC
jgi:hypothetical protein